MVAVGDPVAADHASAGVMVRHLTLPAAFESAGRARLLLRGLAEAVGHDGWLDTGELACTELITNAILHAHTAIDVVARASADELVVEVRDQSPVLPVPRSYDSYATTGRGMALVAALVSEYGIRDAGPAGKTAWFLVRSERGLLEPDEADLLAAWDDATVDNAWNLDVLPAAPPGPGSRGADRSTLSDATDASGRWVQLRGLPPTLWLAARQHHDAILRELALYLAQEDVAGVDLTATDLARTCISGAVWSAVEQARRARKVAPVLPAGHPTPLPWVPEPFDLDLFVPTATARCFTAMQDTLDVAERLAASSRLLARPALPEVVAVRDWACEQVIAQLAGAPTQPWPGTDHERFTADVAEELDVSDWDLDVVRLDERPVVAADDANRIIEVSRPLERLVGWDGQQLVGRRIVTLIPPRLREAHVAGFTRHLTTGSSHILGIPVTLPVLRKDGSEILCRVLIEALPARRGRRYLAHIAPESDRQEP